MYFRASSRSPQVGGLPSPPESRLRGRGSIPCWMKRGVAVTALTSLRCSGQYKPNEKRDRGMNSRVVAALLVLTAVPPLRNAERGSGGEDTRRNTENAARDSALHALSRLAYGPRPGEVERVAAQGVLQWIDQQLEPDKIDDPVLAAREHQFKILASDRGGLARQYVAAQRARRERKRDQGDMDGRGDSVGAQHAAPLPFSAAPLQSPGDAEHPDPIQQKGRRLAAELQNLAVVRAALSE